MRPELPECVRCCFCLPLRFGLLAFGYIDLIYSQLGVYGGIKVLHFLLVQDEYDSVIIGISIAFEIMIIYIVLNCILITGAHKKNVKLLTIAYVGSLVWCALIALVTIGLTFFFLYRRVYFLDKLSIAEFYTKSHTWNPLKTLGESYLKLVLEIYTLLLLRSEIKKLRRSRKFRCVNHDTESMHRTMIEGEEVTDVGEVATEDTCKTESINEE